MYRLEKYKTLRALLYGMLLTGNLLFLSACNGPTDKALKMQAEALADQLYQAIAARDFQKASTFYAAEFYEKVTPQEWIRVLQSEQDKFGGYQKRKLTGSSVTRGFSTRSTIVVVLAYRVYFEKQNTVEKLTYLYYPDSQKFELVGHFIDFTEVKK